MSVRADAPDVDVDRRLLAYWKAQRAARAGCRRTAAESGEQPPRDPHHALDRNARTAPRGGTVALMLDDR